VATYRSSVRVRAGRTHDAVPLQLGPMPLGEHASPRAVEAFDRRGVLAHAWPVRRILGPELALALLSFALAFGALEAGVRLRLPPRVRETLPHVGFDDQDENRLRWLERRRAEEASEDDLRFDQPDALLGWSPIPNVTRRSRQPGAYDVEVHTVADGIRRQSPVAREREPGRTRIAIFGCSQTFGAEVEDGETYGARLERRLHDVEVLNFGVHGFGTDQMLLRWERDGVPYRPDVVVVGFAYYHVLRNLDTFRFFAKPRFVLEGDRLTLVGVPVPTPEAYAATTPPPSPHPLLDRSVLLRWAWQRVQLARESRLYFATSPAWALTRALLARFAREVHEHGARFVLLNVEDDSPQLEPVLDAVAREDGALFVNAGRTLGDLRGAGHRFRVPANAHWGADGHAIIADDIATALCAHGYVPAAACVDVGGPGRSSRRAS
jgi:hypothetical protein